MSKSSITSALGVACIKIARVRLLDARGNIKESEFTIQLGPIHGSTNGIETGDRLRLVYLRDIELYVIDTGEFFIETIPAAVLDLRDRARVFAYAGLIEMPDGDVFLNENRQEVKYDEYGFAPGESIRGGAGF